MLKIISSKTYEELVNKAKDIEDIEDNSEVKELQKIIEEKKKIYDEEIAALKKKYDKKIADMIKEEDDKEKDNKIILARKDFEVDNKISAAVKEVTVERDNMKMDLNNKTKEVEILTKAFENLGFDVKDMKDILNKLVDGVVSKNSIQLIK